MEDTDWRPSPCPSCGEMREKKEVPESLFVQRYKAYKSKVCPGVEYE